MKKLFSLILLALISSQMWGTGYYSCRYASGCTNVMGKLYYKHVAANKEYAAPNFNNPSDSNWKTYDITQQHPSTNYKITYAALNLTGYTFKGWATSASGSVSKTDNPMYLTAGSSDVTYYAVFEAEKYTVSVSASPSAGGSATVGVGTATGTTTSANISYNTTCKLTATPNTNYTFQGWYENNNLVTTDNPATLTITAARSLVAVFEADAQTPSGPTAPTATNTIERTVNRTDNNIRESITGVTIPSTTDAVDLGFDVLWGTKNVGASSSSQKGDYYTWEEASALGANSATLGGAGWRRATYNEFSDLIFYKASWAKDGTSGFNISGKDAFASQSIYLPTTGWYKNGTYQLEGAGGFYWAGPMTSGGSAKYMRANANLSSDYASLTSPAADAQYFIRPVYDLNATGVYKLTIIIVNNGATPATQKANVYYCASGQEFDITPAQETGYTATWDNNTTGKRSFTVTANTTATVTYAVQIVSRTVTVNKPQHGYILVKNAAGTSTIKDTRDFDSNSSTFSVDNDTKVTVEYHADNNYHFVSGAPSLDGNNQFTVNADNMTISGTFAEDAKYTVNITPPTNGTISVLNGSTPVSNGDQVYTGTVLTVTATADVANHYEFKSWKAGTPALDANNQFTLSSNVTIGANFGLEEFTIRFIVDGTAIQTRSEAWGATPILPDPSTVQKPADTYYTYSFAGWDANDDGVADGVSAVSGDQDYVAVFNRTPTGQIPTYNITIGAYSNGTVTLTAGGNVQVVPATGGVYPFEDGTTIIVKAVANRGWHFTQWNDANTSKSRQISEIAANITLTPTFAENVSFNMLDTWDEAACLSNYNFDDVLTVTLVGRTFTAGQWATLSVPFTTTLTADDALYNAIYKFNNVTLSAGGSSVFLEFVRTNDIEKNQPYLVVPRQAINEVVFDGVKLATPAQQAPTTDDRVAFVSTLWQQTISGPNDFYIGKLSTLYYAPNSGMTIKGNRAFFRKIGDAASAPRRAIIVIDGEEVEVEIAGDAIEEVQDVRKYMENGILIIERNGVRMDAQGKRIN